MKITKIEKQQKHRNRVNVYIDGSFSFGMNEILLVDFGLYEGRELTREEVEEIKKGDELSKAMNKAYNFLSYRARSEKEMLDKLLEVFDADIAEKTITKLKEHGYINDIDFAEAWVGTRGMSRGTRVLRLELIKKGIAQEVIDEVLSATDDNSEFETAIRLVESKEKYRVLDRSGAYKKVAPFLMRRGFSYEVVKKVLTEIYPK